MGEGGDRRGEKRERKVKAENELKKAQASLKIQAKAAVWYDIAMKLSEREAKSGSCFKQSVAMSRIRDGKAASLRST